MTDDDHCISYTVAMVDVRSCARPPRSPCQTIYTRHTGT